VKNGVDVEGSGRVTVMDTNLIKKSHKFPILSYTNHALPV